MEGKYFVTKKQIEMEKFKLSSKENGQIVYDEVEGERITVGGVEAFIFKQDIEDFEGDTVDGWNISHLETGMKIASDFDRQCTIDKAVSNCEKYPEAIERGRQICIELGITLPVNVQLLTNKHST